MFFVSLFDIHPAIIQAGYECEMSFTDASDMLGSFSQVLCWTRESLPPWEVCKYSAVFAFSSEFIEQLSLFFGLILISSPKPSIKYVLATRYLMILSAISCLTRLSYSCSAFMNGESFLKSSSSCLFEGSNEVAGNTLEIASKSKYEIIFEALTLTFFCAYIWGTYALVTVLKRGGTGDEKVAGTDVLSLIKVNPPKLLVLSSFFGIAPLRPAALVLTCLLVGLTCFNGFSNIYRMMYWCGQLDIETGWCVWPYGILNSIDTLICLLVCGYTVQTLLHLKSDKNLIKLTILWSYLTVSSLGFSVMSLYILVEKFPAYWMDGMRGDFWVYYARFWISVMIAVLVNSLSIVRLAGGIGWENEAEVKELIYSNLSEAKQDGEESETESLADLFGGGGIAREMNEDIPEPSQALNGLVT